MNSELTLRLFEPEKDKEYVFSTYESLFEDNVPNFKVTEKGVTKFRKEMLSYDGIKGYTFILEKERNQIGYISVMEDIAKGNGVATLIIQKYFINEEERKKGYSKLLMDKALSFAKEKDCKKVILHCYPHNLDYYKKFGFEVSSYWMNLDLE